MLLAFLSFVSLFCKATGYYGNSVWFDGDDFGKVDISYLSVDLNNNSVTISMRGSANNWFGVGFGNTKMDGTYAIIVDQEQGQSIPLVFEYRLGSHTRGDRIRFTTFQIIEATINEGNVTAGIDPFVEIEVTRNRHDNAAGFDFPEVSYEMDESMDFIAASGNQLDYTTATSMNASMNGTVTWSGIDELPCLEDDNDPRDECLVDCFSSDSYVITYPNYERKQIDELEIYDKILTYDELNDNYFFDQVLVKWHFEEGDIVNDVLVEMIEFTLQNDDGTIETLTLTESHLLYIDNIGLNRADTVQIGDKLKHFDGKLVEVVSIKNVVKYPRNLITYNGNLVVNGIAISTFRDTILGENEYWSKSIRFIMKYFYSYNIWRYPVYYIAKLWNEYLSFDVKQAVIKLNCRNEPKQTDFQTNDDWYSSHSSFAHKSL